MSFYIRQSHRLCRSGRCCAALATELLFLGVLGTAQAATISWTNTNGGLWSAPANWDLHVVPRSFDTVAITAAGSYTVTVDTNVVILALSLGGSGQQILTNSTQSVTISNSTTINANGILSLGGGTLAGGPLTVQGTFNWAGGFGYLPITVNAGGMLNLNGSGAYLLGPLTNAGTVNWSSGSITVYNNTNNFTGAIYNQAGALFIAQSDQTVFPTYGPEFFQNAGTVRKTAALGTTSFNVGFTNTGLVDAQSGTLRFAGGGTVDGTYNTATGVTIEFDTGNFFETGLVTITGTGLCRLYGATVTINDRIAKFILASGNVLPSPTFEGSGTIQNLQLDGAYLIGTNTVTGTLGFDGGGIAVGAPLTVAPTGILDFNGAGVTIYSPLTNNGTVNWTGNSLYLNNNTNNLTGAIYNQSAGLFSIQSDQTMSAAYGFEFFQNAGTVRKTAGLGTTSFNLAFTNSALVDAQSGTIRFAGGGNIDGTYNTASGAVIEFDSGNFFKNGPVTITGAGVSRQNGAAVTLDDRIAGFVLAAGNLLLSPNFQTNGSIQNLQLDGASLLGTNVVTGTLGLDGGAIAAASPLKVAVGGTLNFNGAAVNIYSPLTNLGTINWSGNTLSLFNNTNNFTGAIYNQPGALFNIQNDQTVSVNYGPEFFMNAGTVRKTAGLGTTSFNVAFTNTSLVDAQSGTIRFGSGGNVDGTYNTATGAFIEFDFGNFFQNGLVTVTGSGLCRLNGGTITLTDRIASFLLSAGNVLPAPNFQTNGSIQNLQLDGASLLGTNVVTGTLGLNGGGIAAASPLTVATNGTLNFNGAAVNIFSPLTNLGAINWSGNTLSVFNNTNNFTGAIYNQTSGVFTAQSDQNMSINYGYEFFRNSGTVRKTAGLGATTFSIAFTNTGVINAQSGTIHFGTGGNLDGSYSTTAGAVIEFGSGSFAQAGPVTVTGAGLCRLNGASVTLTDRIAGFILAAGNVLLTSNFETNGTIQNLQLDGAYLLGTNVVTGTLGFNGGGMAQGAPLTIAPSGTLNFNGAAVTINAPLTNQGTINWSGAGITIANNNAASTGVIYNQSGALFNADNDQSISYYFGPEFFQNSGTVRKSAGLGTTTFILGFTNLGTLDAQSGIIRFAGSYTPLGGTMNFGLTSLAYFGQIAFAGNAPITGTLSANLNGSYFPSAGDSFALLTYSSRSGLFTNLALPPQATWQTNYGAGTFTITASSVSAGGLSLAPIANHTINPGAILLVTNSAIDANPTNTITYSLTTAPGSATINPTNGILQWRGPANRAGTSNLFTVFAADNGVPQATDSKSFLVFVNPLTPVTLTPLSFAAGHFNFQINGGVGPDYTVQVSTNLSIWVSLSTNTPTTMPLGVVDTNAGGFSRRFYRALIGP